MNIGYQKLLNDYIAKLEILGKTNENRQDIANPQYAQYRTSKVKVLKIFHMNAEVNDETQVIKKMNGLYNNFMYVVGKEIYVDDYDEDVNEVYSRGIYYFKTLEQAKEWKFHSDNYTGQCIKWYDNGNKEYEIEFKDGKFEGKQIKWYRNGNKMYEREYKDGKDEGKWIEWYENGNKKEEVEYKNGKYEGKWIWWWENGNKMCEGEYKDGEREGKWIQWYEDGTIQYEGEYKDGVEEKWSNYKKRK